jgi:hypothetical protein
LPCHGARLVLETGGGVKAEISATWVTNRRRPRPRNRPLRCSWFLIPGYGNTLETEDDDEDEDEDDYDSAGANPSTASTPAGPKPFDRPGGAV